MQMFEQIMSGHEAAGKTVLAAVQFGRIRALLRAPSVIASGNRRQHTAHNPHLASR